MKQAKLFRQDESKVLGELDYKDALALANQVKDAISPHCDRLEVVGSIRRGRPMIHDVDFVVIAGDDGWIGISETLRRMKAQTSCAGKVVIRSLVPCNKSLFQVDFYRAKHSTFGINQLIRTGSADHNMWLAGYAISKGMRIKYSEGLIKDNTIVAGQNEKDVFAALSLPFPQPQDRELVDRKPVWTTQEGSEEK